MKKNIKDYIGTKTAIWIDANTIEQENAIKDLLIEDGRITRWYSGAGLKALSYLSDYTKEQGYCLCFDVDNRITRDTIKSAKCGHQIIPASEFLQPEFEYLQEIEVCGSEDFKFCETRKYIATLPNGVIVALSEDEKRAVNWKYARKINNERTEAISTIKELMQKFNISKDEI